MVILEEDIIWKKEFLEAKRIMLALFLFEKKGKAI